MLSGLGLGVGRGLGIGAVSPRPSFDYFVSDLAAGGGDGSYGDPYLPAELTALGSVPEGSRIGIRAGGVFAAGAFDPMLDLIGDGLDFAPYGDGDAPLFLLRAPIGGAWSSLGSNKWRWTGAQANNSTMSGNVFRDGEPMQLVPDSGSLDAPGKALVTAWGWDNAGIVATSTFSVDIYSTVDPARDGHDYSYSRALSGFRLSGDDCAITDITVEGAGNQNGNVISYGRGTVLRRCTLRHGSRHGALLGPDARLIDCTFEGGRNRQVFGAADHVVCFASAFAGSEGISFRGCSFSGGDYLDISGDNLQAFQAHDADDDALPGTALFDHCSFADGMIGASPAAAEMVFASPAFDGVKYVIGQRSIDCDISIAEATGSVGSLFYSHFGSGVQTLATARCVLTLDGDLHGNNFKSAVVSTNGGGICHWVEDHDTLVWDNSDTGFRSVCFIEKGSVTRYDTSLSGALQRHDQLAEGNAAGDVTFAGDRNSYKSGLAWNFKEQSPANLTAWQTLTGQDGASVAI